MDLDGFLRDLYDCRACARGGATGFSAPPHGRVASARPDVLLLGWNPQVRGFPPERPSFEQWREDGAAGLENASAPFRALVGRLLPPGYSLSDGRVVNTRVWKWPSPDKRPEDQARARLCAERHLWRECELLRPRLLLTYDKDASSFFQDAARERGISMQPAPIGIRSSAAVGWIETTDRWGWPMGAVLSTGLRAKARGEVDWIRAKAAEVLSGS